MRPPHPEPWTSDTVRAHADSAFAVLVNLWQQEGVCPPVAVLYTADGHAVAVPELDDVPKEVMPSYLRALATTLGASHVLFACAATFVEAEGEREAAALVAWRASGRPLAEHPNAVDCLFLSVDGPGIRTGMRAMRDKDGQVTTDVIENAEMGGTMVNLSGRLGEN